MVGPMKACLFCDQKVKNTREHAWPNWTANVLGTLYSVEVEFGDGTRRQWASAPLRVKRVCRNCNEGWMSDLESKNRPLLGGMMSDLSVRLNRADQQIVAAWCVKTAMVLEATSRTTSFFYTNEDRARLRQELLIPYDTLIWLGRQHRSDYSYAQGRRLERSSPSPILREGYVTTLAAGRLVMQVMSVHRQPEHRGRIVLDPVPGPWGNTGLLQIWPTDSPSIRWPPRWSFANEPELDALTERFKRR
jgi:hypothetical protein